MKRTIKFIMVMVLSLSFVLNPMVAKANEFESAEKRKLNTKFSIYADDQYYYKIKVKKKGKYTISLNTKLWKTSIAFYNKNGKLKERRIIKKKVKQGKIWRDYDGSFNLETSDVTGRFKGSFTVKLKKGTHYIYVYPCTTTDAECEYKLKFKTSFKK